MARKLTRSHGSTQVVPDALLTRRFDLLCSWDEPTSQAANALPLMARGRGRSIFDGVDLELVLVSEKRSFPMSKITYGGHTLHTMTVAGRDLKSRMKGTSVLTITSKMMCPSFSLGAGPTTEGGTCASANMGRDGGLRVEGKTYICDGCYSLEGFYIQASVGISQAARRAWVLQQLQRDPSGELLADQLAAVIEDYARNATLKGAFGGMGRRLTQEIGIWQNGRVHIPAILPDLGRTVLIPAYQTPVAQSWYASQQIPENAVAGFFRVHDSGDFSIGSAALWLAYVDAWVGVAKRLPHVVFWVPTRLWTYPKVLSRLRSRAEQVPNLIIRPSALHVGDEAPTTSGLSAGTTVAAHVRGSTYESTKNSTGKPCYLCPVYTTKAKRDKSCMASDCRICWLRPDLSVAYGWH